jgi:hypothetical protein
VRRLGRFVRIALWLFGLAAVLAAAAPFVALRRSTSRATECIARFEKPRGPRLPDCSADIPELSRLAKLPFLRHDTTYRAEELWSRIMMAEYVNASVGNPDPRTRAQTAGFVDQAETVVERGSQRIQLDDLGPAVAAPHLGKLASSLGDRRTLVDHYDWWGLWSVRVHAIQAALLEGDLDKAGAMARRYYDWDPRDPDLRTAMGAALCLGPDLHEGLDLLTRVPGDRAEKRYAAIARNYGEVLAVMEACAAKAGVDAPAPPSETRAGIADVPEARMVQDLRLVKVPALAHEAGDRAIAALESEGGLDEDSARVMLLAALAVYDDRFGLDGGPLAPSVVASLATPRDREGPLSPPLHLLPSDVLSEPLGVRPTLSAEALARASAALEALAARAKPSEDAPDPALRLRRVAAAASVHAALAFARAGNVDGAVGRVGDAARLAGSPKRAAALSAASVAYVAGSASKALDQIVGAEGDDPGTEAGIAFVSALAHASLHQRDTARAELARCLHLVDKAGDPVLANDARWLELAFGEAGTGGVVRPVYTGMADPTQRWIDSAAPALRDQIDAFRRAYGASDADKLAFRYELMRVRGDAPTFALPYLLAGGRLVGGATDAAGVEVWLDALSAADVGRMPLSAYAWHRLEAARIRGDEVGAAAWQKRLGALRAMRSVDADLDIARFLGL